MAALEESLAAVKGEDAEARQAEGEVARQAREAQVRPSKTRSRSKAKASK